MLKLLADAVFWEGVEQDVGDLVDGALFFADFGLIILVDIMDIVHFTHLWYLLFS